VSQTPSGLASAQVGQNCPVQTPEDDRYDVVVIGAGPAGTAAGLRAAELGARVAVVEAKQTGGTCVHTGCVPTRVLAQTARLLRQINTADEFGIDRQEPHLRWPETVERVHRVIREVQAAKGSANALKEAGADLIEGHARFVDPHTVQLAGSDRQVSADAFVVCVGGHSRALPVPGGELAWFAEHVLDLPELPRSVAIIGSGATGLQLATVFDAFGADVTVLELQPRMLPGSDHDVSRVVTDTFRSQGIRVETGIDGVSAIEEGADGGRRVIYGRNGRARTVDVDVVIASIGWPVSVEGLGLDEAGVLTGGATVPVDAYFRSNVPHIFVAGDANGRSMLVQAAKSEAFAAATNAVLGASRNAPHGLLPSGGFTDPDYAGVGLTEEEARARDPQCVVAYVPYAEMERAIIDHRTTGFLKLIADRRRSLLLGAHAVGESAVEVIQAVTTAMAAGVDVATLASVEFAYPTYTAIVGEAAARLMAVPSPPNGQAATR